MPVTPAHVVAAVPSWRRACWWAPALAFGAVAPDLPQLLSRDPTTPASAHLRELSHTWWAALTVDAAVAALLAIAWVWCVRPAAMACAPAGVRERWQSPTPTARGRAAMGVGILAIWCGTVSHVLVDAAVHRKHLGVWTAPVFGQVATAQVLQYTLSLIGVGWLAWEAWRFLQRPRHEPLVTPAPGAVRWVLAIGLVAIGVAAGVGRLGEFSSPRSGLRLYGTMVRAAALRAVSVLSVVVLALSVMWRAGGEARARRVRRHAEARTDRVGAAR